MTVAKSLIYPFVVISTPHCIVIVSHCLVCTCSCIYHAMKSFHTRERLISPDMIFLLCYPSCLA